MTLSKASELDCQRLYFYKKEKTTCDPIYRSFRLLVAKAWSRTMHMWYAPFNIFTSAEFVSI